MCVLLTVIAPSTQGGDRLPYKFCDPSATLEDRVADLLGRMTYEEKSMALAAGALDPIPRLGYVPLSGGESTHGVSAIATWHDSARRI